MKQAMFECVCLRQKVHATVISKQELARVFLSTDFSIHTYIYILYIHNILHMHKLLYSLSWLHFKTDLQLH